MEHRTSLTVTSPPNVLQRFTSPPNPKVQRDVFHEAICIPLPSADVAISVLFRKKHFRIFLRLHAISAFSTHLGTNQNGFKVTIRQLEFIFFIAVYRQTPINHVTCSAWKKMIMINAWTLLTWTRNHPKPQVSNT